jgi:hypothetical protein
MFPISKRFLEHFFANSPPSSRLVSLCYRAYPAGAGSASICRISFQTGAAPDGSRSLGCFRPNAAGLPRRSSVNSHSIVSPHSLAILNRIVAPDSFSRRSGAPRTPELTGARSLVGMKRTRPHEISGELLFERVEPIRLLFHSRLDRRRQAPSCLNRIVLELVWRGRVRE